MLWLLLQVPTTRLAVPLYQNKHFVSKIYIQSHFVHMLQTLPVSSNSELLIIFPVQFDIYSLVIEVYVSIIRGKIVAFSNPDSPCIFMTVRLAWRKTLAGKVVAGGASTLLDFFLSEPRFAASPSLLVHQSWNCTTGTKKCMTSRVIFAVVEVENCFQNI